MLEVTSIMVVIARISTIINMDGVISELGEFAEPSLLPRYLYVVVSCIVQRSAGEIDEPKYTK